MIGVLVWLGIRSVFWELFDDDLGESDNPVEFGTSEGKPVVQIGIDNFFESVDDFPEGVDLFLLLIGVEVSWCRNAW